ncbi:MAG: ribonuclease HI family protein [Candidatus Methanomethylophilaceae archaeon]|nr:ribonuclease HI family protein [Candidatus Methanomethylophilaceae archaeon]
MRMRFYSDGGARGNPGPAAFAVIVCKADGFVLHEYARFIGVATNNEAEYQGLISALGTAIDYKTDDAEFVMDSELVVKQMKGEYKVKSPHLKKLHQDAMSLAKSIGKTEFRHVRREDPKITRADELLNQELDRRR